MRALLASLIIFFGLNAQIGHCGEGARRFLIDPKASNVSFVTIKASQPGVASVLEVAQFGSFTGGLRENGSIELEIDLSSVDTGVVIRDDRLRSMFFDVVSHPKARWSAKIDPRAIFRLAAGVPLYLESSGSLAFAGTSKRVDARLSVVKLDARTLLVSTVFPIIVDASQFGLSTGVEALREIMGLNFISSSAPVSANLLLRLDQ